jgi:hypothetical protein
LHPGLGGTRGTEQCFEGLETARFITKFERPEPSKNLANEERLHGLKLERADEAQKSENQFGI